MAATTTQISALVSAETKERLERYARMFGVKKSHFIETAFSSGDADLDRFSRNTLVRTSKQYGFEPLEVVRGQLGDRPAPLPMFLPLGSIPKGSDDQNA